jgi:hypothetical protein
MTERSKDWGAVHRVRLGHVRRLLLHRYGPKLPNDDAGADDLRILLHVKAQCYVPKRREQALLSEIELSAPWMTNVTAAALAAEIAAKPMRLKADTLGRMLNLDWMTRERLRLWQIGAVDDDAEGRKRRRKQRHAERMWRKRRAEGRADRQAYLASALSNTKPWLAMGISRRTYERRRAKGTLSQVCAQTSPRTVASVCAKYLSSGTHTLATTPKAERAAAGKRTSDEGGDDRSVSKTDGGT